MKRLSIDPYEEEVKLSPNRGDTIVPRFIICLLYTSPSPRD